MLSCNNQQKWLPKSISKDAPSMFNEDIKAFYFKTLDSAAHFIKKIDTTNSLRANQNFFLLSRKWYKRLEPLLIAYDYENYKSMNAPNLLKVEIDDYTDIKKLKPKSYQVLEEYLFGDDSINNKELQRVYKYLQVRIPYIRNNHGIYRQQDRHHLKMIRDAIVNIATKGITGFDSPILANSLQEALYNYESIKEILSIYENAFNDNNIYKSWVNEINDCILTLKAGAFNTFDRYSFIKQHTNIQLELVNKTSLDWGISLSKSRPLNPTSTNIFSESFFNKKMFAPPHSPDITPERINLGRTLFNDKSLSGPGTVSCATCHIKEKAFTDGNKLAIGLNGKPLQRNSPTLPYAVYQKSFFYDGRGDGLEGQIVGVTNNKNEFHIDLNTLAEKVKNKPVYKTAFDSLYNGIVNDRNVRNAIATYIRSLTPFNSKFDRNMQGKENSLTEEEILGFNLFMGKAACATCHFPPSFYGTVPPKFDETEFENLGMIKTANFNKPELDEDPGMFYPYKVEEKRGFFKTATVRNVELTAPYMHNGAFGTLEEVIKFYNLGGGQGSGLDVPFQTLPASPLELEDSEINALIAFMHTLTDKVEEY